MLIYLIFKSIFFHQFFNIDSPSILGKINIFFYINIRIFKIKLYSFINILISNLAGFKFKKISLYFNNFFFEKLYLIFLQYFIYLLVLLLLI